MTIVEIETKIGNKVGVQVHQSVSGNIVNLVEDQLVVRLNRKRQYVRTKHLVYVQRDHFVEICHGFALTKLPQSRKTVADLEYQDRILRKIGSSRKGSDTRRIIDLLIQYPNGLTYDEIETKLHKSMSLFWRDCRSWLDAE